MKTTSIRRTDRRTDGQTDGRKDGRTDTITFSLTRALCKQWRILSVMPGSYDCGLDGRTDAKIGLLLYFEVKRTR